MRLLRPTAALSLLCSRTGLAILASRATAIITRTGSWRSAVVRRRLAALAILLLPALMLLPLDAAQAQIALPAVAIKTAANGAQTYSLTFQVLILMTVLTLLPAILLAMTAFTRIIIVLSILRQALGMATTPSNQILTGLALFMTFFVMSTTIEQSYANGIKPYLDGQVAGEVALDRTVQPLKKFMLAQTRENDLQLFSKLSGKAQFATPDDVPLAVLIPTFITSELKTAFQIGFMVFIPFLVIDLVVASVLMSMGMMMLSPVLVSLPFKIMLFVVVDGWTLLMGTLAASFHQ
jgi:flagellar biosynthetic protein FliP